MITNKNPLILNRDLAKKLGLNEALVLQQIHYWLEKNKKSNRNFYEGRYWTYNTLEEWQEEFIFWSINTVKRTFKRLRDMGILLTDNFNSYQMDRTLWYSIDYEKLKEIFIDIYNDDDISPDCTIGKDQIEPTEEPLLDLAIPEITTENSSDIFNHSIYHEKTRFQKTDRWNDDEEKFVEEYNRIIDKCELFAVDESYHDAVSQAIKILLIETENKKRIKIGENYIPAQLIKTDLEKLNNIIISHAIYKFKEASYAYTIKNTIGYLKSCIVNGISDMKIDIDSELRTSGII